MGTRKDRNGTNLKEAEEIRKKWQEYIEELYKKDLHEPDNYNAVITDLEPDILECEVKWALESITMNKASGGDRIPVELFQILKDDTENATLNMPANGRLSSGHRTRKGQFSFQSQRKAMPTECSNYRITALISHASKVMLKILQVRLQQYMNCEFPDIQAGFRIGRGTRDQIANICWIIEKAREFQRNIYFCFIDYAKAFDSVDHNKRWEYQTTLPASWEICMQVKKQQLELDMEQQTGSKLGKEMSSLYIVTLLI